MLYLGLVEPKFRYCCSVWDTIGVTTRHTLGKLQNRAIRTISNSKDNEPVLSRLKELPLHSISEMIKQESASMVYKAQNAEVSVYLTEQFNRVFDITKRSLSSSNLNLRPPKLKTFFIHFNFPSFINLFHIQCKI